MSGLLLHFLLLEEKLRAMGEGQQAKAPWTLDIIAPTILAGMSGHMFMSISFKNSRSPMERPIRKIHRCKKKRKP